MAEVGTILAGTYGVLDSVLGTPGYRTSRREKRDQILNALYKAGVSRQAFTKVHSDHWRDLQEVAQWVAQKGQPAIAYINETLPDGTGDYWDNKLIDGFDAWARKNASEPIFTSPSPGQDTSPSPGQTAGPAPSAFGGSTQQLLKFGVLAGVAWAIIAMVLK